MIPIGNRYTATATGRVWKPVDCKHCHCQFAYQVTVSAKGTGRSLLFLNNDGARDNARAEAAENLENKMASTVGIVPCPDCGKYQDSMVEKLRMQSLEIAGGIFLGMVVALVALSVSMKLNFTVVVIGFAAVYGLATVLPRLAAGAVIAALVTGLLGGLMKDQFLIGAVPALLATGFFLVRAFRMTPTPVKGKMGFTMNKKHPVITRADFERLAAELKAKNGQVIAMPFWSKR